MSLRVPYLALTALALGLGTGNLSAARDVGSVDAGNYGFRAQTRQGNGLLIERDNGRILVQRFKSTGLRLNAQGKFASTVATFRPNGSLLLISKDSGGKVIEKFVGKWRRRGGTNAIQFNARDLLSRESSRGTAWVINARLSGLSYHRETGARGLYWTDHF